MTIKGKGGIESESRRIEQIQQEIGLVRKTRKDAVAGSVVSDRDDTVDVSRAREVKSVLEAAESDPARRARIEELKKQVAAGTYELPSSDEQIAQMISNINEEVEDLQDLVGE